jgi:hypothetical protein
MTTPSPPVKGNPGVPHQLLARRARRLHPTPPDGTGFTPPRERPQGGRVEVMRIAQVAPRYESVPPPL